ncbi:MAG: hypothetical protein AAF490_31500 [Chloroflexota bacterium]
MNLSEILQGMVIYGRLLSGLLGVLIVLWTIISAIKAFITPRGARTNLTRTIFKTVYFLFELRVRNANYEKRDQIMALFSPITLFLYPFVMLNLILVGYMLIYWSLGIDSIYEIFRESGSSLLTLGYASEEGFLFKAVEFSEAMLGLILVALLIAYLPTMYAAFSRRETNVLLLESRASSPPSMIDFIARTCRNGELEELASVWTSWQLWFAELEESHTSLALLPFFRSPQPNHSWVTAAGVVLDSASMILSAVDIPYNAKAPFLIRTGYLSLNRIARFFQVAHTETPDLTAPISISKAEFFNAFDALAQQDVPMVADREKAWVDFYGWRINYDRALLSLAALTMAPYAEWVSDRSIIQS